MKNLKAIKECLYSKIPLAQTIVSLCQLKGLNQIVISPGSRNAPLTIGFTENPEMTCYSIVDERCAAFFALGIAQQLRQPVVLVCTSGSALLNYYPAIAEAYYSDIPLIVLSADRPVERIDIGDGQTIRQKNVFDNHILYSANLCSEGALESKVDVKQIRQKLHESQKKYNEREINHALNIAKAQSGPVHINVPFHEPLYDKVSFPTTFPENILIENTIHTISEELLPKMIKNWNRAKKKMVLIGVNKPNVLDNKWLDTLANDPSVLVLTETTSNIHHHSHINSIDQLISSLNKEELESLRPDILLTLGGLVVSKKIKTFLRDYQPQCHWHIDEKKAYDTYFCLTEHVKQNPNIFFSKFLLNIEPQHNPYKSFWLGLRDERRKRHQQFLKNTSFSDIKVFAELFNKIPNGEMIQLSNSSTVRYAQLFSLNSTHKIYCNRGTSGIDGSTSTAIGAAVALKESTTLITGDLSFFYDSNGLWNNYIPSSFKIIIINNGGGGIFRILPGKEESDNFSRFFETTHNLTAQQLCKMHSIEYHAAESLKQVSDKLDQIYQKNSNPQLLEVFTPRKKNNRVLNDYFKCFA